MVKKDKLLPPNEKLWTLLKTLSTAMELREHIYAVVYPINNTGLITTSKAIAAYREHLREQCDIQNRITKNMLNKFAEEMSLKKYLLNTTPSAMMVTENITSQYFKSDIYRALMEIRKKQNAISEAIGKSVLQNISFTNEATVQAAQIAFQNISSERQLLWEDYHHNPDNKDILYCAEDIANKLCDINEADLADDSSESLLDEKYGLSIETVVLLVCTLVFWAVLLLALRGVALDRKYIDAIWCYTLKLVTGSWEIAEKLLVPLAYYEMYQNRKSLPQKHLSNQSETSASGEDEQVNQKKYPEGLP